MTEDIEPTVGLEYYQALEYAGPGGWNAYADLSSTRISCLAATPLDAMTKLAQNLATERFALVQELATRPAARTP